MNHRSHADYKLLIPTADAKGTPPTTFVWKTEIAKLRLALKKLEFIEHFYADKTNYSKYSKDGKYAHAHMHARHTLTDLYYHILSDIAVQQSVITAEDKPSKEKYSPSPNLRHPEQIVAHLKKVLMAAIMAIRIPANTSVNHPDALLKRTMAYCLDHIDEQLPATLGFFTRTSGTYNEYMAFYEKNTDKLSAGMLPLRLAETQVDRVMKDHLILLNMRMPPPPAVPEARQRPLPHKLIKKVSFAPIKSEEVIKPMIPPGLTEMQAYRLRRREMAIRLQADLPTLQVDRKDDAWQDMYEKKRQMLRRQ